MRTTALLLAGSMLLATTLPAQGPQYPQPPRSQKPSRSQIAKSRNFRRLTVPGEEVAKNVKRLTKELHWHRTLASALAAGRSKAKPILWVQALGDLRGFL